MVTLTLPMRLESLANEHTHWRTRQRRVKSQRSALALALATRGKPPPLPVVVEIHVQRPRALDSDNLVAACKSVRDEVAAWLRVDDRSDLLAWTLSQSRGKDALTIVVRQVTLAPEETIIVRRHKP